MKGAKMAEALLSVVQVAILVGCAGITFAILKWLDV
jgi:hypothetical protein